MLLCTVAEPYLKLRAEPVAASARRKGKAPSSHEKRKDASHDVATGLPDLSGTCDMSDMSSFLLQSLTQGQDLQHQMQSLVSARGKARHFELELIAECCSGLG